MDLAARAVHAALEIGIEWFDHAGICRRGRAEQVFGEVLRLGSLMRHPDRIEPVPGTSNPDRIRAFAAAEARAAAMSTVEWYALYTAARGKAVP